jgi:crossover junction endodeoxyribonuclease RuvC
MIKKSVVGVGKADKEQVIMMVKRLLYGAAPSSSDEADALAAAICHSSYIRNQIYDR